MIKKSANNQNQMVHKYFYHTYTETTALMEVTNPGITDLFQK